MTTSKISLLIVEDQELVLCALEKLFREDERFQVIGAARDGQSAIELALKLRPHIILMDIGLPLTDGIKATREIKTTNPEMKILMLTADADDDSVFAALAAGADGYCTKSTPIKDLFIAIIAIQSGAGWLDRKIARRVFDHVRRPQQAPANKYGLTLRELDVLALIVDGAGNKDIADRLSISKDTVKTHVRNIFEKLMVSDRTTAALKALDEGL